MLNEIKLYVVKIVFIYLYEMDAWLAGFYLFLVKFVWSLFNCYVKLT